MIHYDTVKHWPFGDDISAYSVDDCIRYALSLGMAADPLDEDELRFVLEDDIRVLPTFLATVGAPGAWASNPATGIDWQQILHGEHRMRFFGALPASASVRSQTRVSGIVDKGAGKGALVTTVREVSDADTGRPLAHVEHVSFCRADGGYSATGVPNDTPLEPLPAAPTRAPDAQLEMPTQRNAALLYRLNGDRNPVHAVPAAWRQAGFDQPILHGLCSYGMAARGLVKLACGNDPARLNSLAARFSAPVYPGETLVLSQWQDGARVHFEMHAQERGLKVLSHGVATVAVTTVAAA